MPLGRAMLTAVIALSSLTLAGCVPGVSGTDRTPSPTPSRTAVAVPAAEPSPSAPVGAPSPSASTSPTPVRPLTCETLLTPAVTAKLVAAGQVLYPEFASTVAASTDDTLRAFLDYGGLVCRWGPPYASDVVYDYGYSAISESQAALERQRLSEDGWLKAADDGSAEKWFRVNPDESLYRDVYEFLPGSWRYALTVEELAGFSL